MIRELQEPATPRGCPAPELLAAYVDGRQDRAEAETVERHLSTCSRCFGMFAETLRFRQTDPDWRPLPRAWSLPRAVGLAAGLVAAATLVGTLGWFAWQARGRRAEVAALVDALGDRRVVEPRLTGGFAYGPVPPLTRSAGPAEDASLEVTAAAAALERAARERPGPRATGALGVAHLVLGDTTKAVDLLEEAVAQAPQDGRLASDLAAAYLARARLEEHPDDVPRALAVAERALRDEPRLAEALFNRALALEGLSLTVQAEEAWTAYLEVDPRSAWAEEARRHLDALRRSRRSQTWGEAKERLLAAVDRGEPVSEDVRRFGQQTREYLEDELLPEWARAAASRADAGPPLHRARALAEALFAVTGDPLDRDAVAVLSASATGARRTALIEGHQAFGEGRALYLRDDFDGASRPLGRAQAVLERSGSPLAAWARLYLVRAVDYPKDRGRALRELSRLEDLARQRDYRALRGRALWLRGLIRESRSELTGAVEDYEAALACFRLTGEDDAAVQIHLMMASSFDEMGDPGEGWSQRLRALRLMSPASTPRRTMSAYTDATRAALRQRMPGVAVHFERALIEAAQGWGSPAALADAHVQQALLHHEIGNDGAALQDLEAARRAQRDIADASLAEGVRSQVSLAAGVLLARRRPEEAVAALSDAVDYLQARGESQRLPLAYLLRGRALLAEGRADAAERDFEQGIRVFEDRRRRQERESARISFFAGASELFDEEVSLQVQRRDPERALGFTERQRARELLDVRAAASSSAGPGVVARPLGPEEIRPLLPEGLALVYYSARPDRLLAWVVTRCDVRFAETPITIDALKDRLAAWRLAASRRGAMSEVEEAGGRLYDLLVAPLATALPPEATLVFVPDATLQDVAFAGLWDRRRGRFLVQDHALGVVPSGSVLVWSRARLRELRARSGGMGALAVGNPRFDRVLFRGLAPLPGAEAEAGEIARLYAGATTLVGPDATRDRLLAEAGRREVIHYAGHALPARYADGPFRLLLARDPGQTGDGTLDAQELARVAFARTRLVVLAACGSGAGPTVEGEGRLGPGRTLLAAGVPSVVASLWNVEDAASRRLFAAFHRAFIADADAPRALRAAQRSLIEADDPELRHPAAWAAFEAMGAAVSRSSPEGGPHAADDP